MSKVCEFIKSLFGSQKQEESHTEKVEDNLALYYSHPRQYEMMRFIIGKVPRTARIFFLHETRQLEFSEEWKYWAWEMMEKGFQTPEIIQLAGVDSSVNPFEFASLVECIFGKMWFSYPAKEIFHQYILYVAGQVVAGELTAEQGLKLLWQAYIDSDDNEAFEEFYFIENDWEDLKDGCEPNTSYFRERGISEERIDEWLHGYFEKMVAIKC
ncbi:MAG: hypothetical protein J6Y37_18160 [Paludibacteraceae bacterium]|nr:hypothetical protein [Paludibacteraceae bacterium]